MKAGGGASSDWEGARDRPKPPQAWDWKGQSCGWLGVRPRCPQVQGTGGLGCLLGPCSAGGITPERSGAGAEVQTVRRQLSQPAPSCGAELQTGLARAEIGKAKRRVAPRRPERTPSACSRGCSDSACFAMCPLRVFFI